MIRSRAARRFWAVGAVGVVMLASAACSSSDSGGSGGGGEKVTFDAAAVGVPTLDQLYRGTETTPPTTSPPRAQGKSVYWISCGQQVPDCATKAEEGRKAVEAIGWKFTLVDGNIGTGGAYSAAIRTALAANADAIVEDAFTCPDVQQPLQEAKAKGTLVIGMETLDCSDSGGEKLFSADMLYGDSNQSQADYWQAMGKNSAAYLINASNGKAQVINNPGRNSQQQMLNKGFLTELAKCPGCKVVDTVEWSTEDYVPNGPWIAAFRSSLVKHPEATAVYMPFDSMPAGLGGSQAIQEAGRTICSGAPAFGSSCVIGVGGIGTAESLDLIRKGQWTALGSARDDRWVAWAAVDELNRKFNGQPAVPQGIGFRAIDQSNGLPAVAGTPYETPVDFRAAYLKSWGVQQPN